VTADKLHPRPPRWWRPIAAALILFGLWLGGVLLG